jgi:phage tail-like protein
MTTENALAPFHVFRFHVDFHDAKADPENASSVPICSGAFSECTGLEATMEPKVIKEGGRNNGHVQRAGPVTFATVVLKRGMTTTRHLWNWFQIVSDGGYAYRLTVTINVYDNSGEAKMAWKLANAMPLKFKAADLNARGSEVGIEELHLAHEGLTTAAPTRPNLYE